MYAGARPRLRMTPTYSPDPLYGRIWRDDQDTVTVDGREDPSERAGREPAEDISLPDCHGIQAFRLQPTASSASWATFISMLVPVRTSHTSSTRVIAPPPTPTTPPS